jgi:uncharacterized YkwD family protein
MKKKIAVLALLAIAIASFTCYSAAAVEGDGIRLALEKIEDNQATVTANRLNVREGPSTSFQSICKLDKGHTVSVMGKLGDWYAIYIPDTGIVGAVYGEYLELGSNNAITVASNEDTALKKAPDKGSPPSSKLVLSEDEQKLLDLVNQARAEKGLDALKVDENLMKTSRIKARDMIENNYFSHQSPTYGSPFDMMRQFDTVFKSAGENIAGNKTVEGAFKAWMSSDSHKKNVLNPAFGFTGIGVENSPTYGKIFVQQFIGK